MYMYICVRMYVCVFASVCTECNVSRTEVGGKPPGYGRRCEELLEVSGCGIAKSSRQSAPPPSTFVRLHPDPNTNKRPTIQSSRPP